MTDTNAQGFMEFSDGTWCHLFGISTGGVFTDGTEAEMYVRNIGGGQEQLFKSHENKVINRIALQLADGSILTTAMLYNAQSGVVARWRGSERNLTTVKKGSVYDLDVKTIFA